MFQGISQESLKNSRNTLGCKRERADNMNVEGEIKDSSGFMTNRKTP